MIEIVQADPASAGLDGVLAGMLVAAAADSAKAAVLARMSGSVLISITDLSADLRLGFDRGRVTVLESTSPADLRLTMPSSMLLALSSVPKVVGVPSPLHPDGRSFFLGLLTRKARIGGLRHARLLSQLMTVLGG